MSFEVEPNKDPSRAHALETALGWPRAPREVERRFLVAEGFVAVDAGRDVGSATLALYRGRGDDVALAWIGGMAVLPEHRGRGVGRALLRACLARADAAGARVVGLDATEAGRPLYEKEGFRAVVRTTRWGRRDATPVPLPVPLPSRHAVHPISLSEVMEIAEFDLARFGARRLPWLLLVQADLPWQAFMSRDRRTGDVSGYALGNDRHVGPIVADDDEAAAFLLAACQRAGAPGTVYALDDPHAERVLAAAGHQRENAGLTRMARGGDLPMRREAIYAVGAWALG